MNAKAFLQMYLVRFLFVHLTFLSLCSCDISDLSESLPLFGTPEQNYVVADENSGDEMSDYVDPESDSSNDYNDPESDFSNKTVANHQVNASNIIPDLKPNDNQTELESPDPSEVFESEFDYRADNETDFGWLADYNISELEPSELFFPSEYIFLFFKVQWGSEDQTSLVLEWRNIVPIMEWSVFRMVI